MNALRHGACSGGKRTKAYAVWISMRMRCYQKSNPSWPWYGKKGVKVCKRWQTFENFLEDMGEPPSPKHQIDRINGGNYHPGNCRWVTSKENNRNRCSTRWISYRGKTHSLTEWSEISGIKLRTIKARLDYLGWPLDEVFSRKVGKQGKYKKQGGKFG